MSMWQDMEATYFLRTGKRLPVTLVRGQGTRVWDDQGKEYLDFIDGIAVCSLGHCHPVVVNAIAEQSRTLMHVSNLFYTVPQLRLAELLVQNSCLQRAYFVNSGTEANEAAIKLARRYGKLHRDGAYEIITALDSFHGRSLAMVAATGQKKYQEPYTPLPEGFVNVPYNDLSAIKKATTKKTCAIMLEPVEGEGGVIVPAPDYLKQVRKWCDAHNILLILDEVQTGIGRTGALFAYQRVGAEPDIMTLAKGLGGGFPIGAVLAKERAAVFQPGDHGSTFGGNPLATATACATVRHIIEERIPDRVRDRGDYLMAGLGRLKARHARVTDVRGMGLLTAIEFDAPISEALTLACLEEGLIVNNVKSTALRLAPALVVTKADIDEALSILDKVIARVAARPVPAAPAH
ncbi:MAG: acetylornithine transaminase [Chloroflexi bacterium]|nr:acetylornithine transaminase [Chloroflexota bacterium]